MIQIVAELSANHKGSLSIAIETIKAAKESGATMIKAQAYTPDGISVKGYKIKLGPWKGRDYHDLYTEGQTPYEWFPTLKKVSEDLGMEFFASAFDYGAVDMLERLGVKRHKVASFEITDIPLIKYMVSKGKPLIVSTGIATSEDIEEVKQVTEDVTWFVCTSAYPALPSDMGLNRMAYFNNVGLSDHSLGIIAPVLSVAYNPLFIEKHFILDKSFDTIDSGFSADPKEFKAMVTAVREAEEMNRLVSPRVDRSFARSLWVVRDIKKGEVFTKDNIKSLRPNNGLAPKELNNILGLKSVKNLTSPCPLQYSMVGSHR